MDTYKTDGTKLKKVNVFDAEREAIAARKLARQIAQAKEKRFTLSSRILTQKEINVSVVNDTSETNPAWINMANLDLTLNEAYPRKYRTRLDSEIETLVFDRAKLYHELGHALFTTNKDKIRDVLWRKSRNPQLFLDVSNVLEDGRIERCMSERFRGVQLFFDSFLAEMMKESIAQKGKKNPFASLVIYVRKFIMRNADDAAFWQPYIANIGEAVACDNTERVCQIAYDIVEAIAKKAKEKAEQPKPPKPEPDKQGKDKDKDKGEPTQQSGEGGTGQGVGEDEGEPTEPEELDQNGLTEASRDALEKLTGEALKLTESEARQEYDSILEEISEGGLQEYGCDTEAAASQQLSEILRSLVTEQSRSRDHQAKAGKLNSLALPKALTNKTCFNTVEEGKGKPHVALLLDISGSMGCRSMALTSAARILNGALRASGIETLTLTYGGPRNDGVQKMSAIASDDFLHCGGGTPTGDAMHAANDWLEEQNATRGLIIVVTDGGPNDWPQVTEEKTRANNLGAHVLGVAVETDLDVVTSQCNAAIALPNVADLPSALEPALTDYINGIV